MTQKKFLTRDFRKQFPSVVESCFTRGVQVHGDWVFDRLVSAALFRIWNYFWPLCCLCLLLLRSPRIVIAQLLLRREGGLSGSYQWTRLEEIASVLRRTRPNSVIEFGSGASSLVFNAYLEPQKSLRIVEEDPLWRDKVIRVATFLRLRNYKHLPSRLILSSRIEDSSPTNGVLSSYYQYTLTPGLSFDFAYIDGPTSWIHYPTSAMVLIDPHKLLPNIDVALLKVLPKIILIDGRRSTITFFLNSGIFDSYEITPSFRYVRLWSNQVFGTYHTLLQSAAP